MSLDGSTAVVEEDKDTYNCLLVVSLRQRRVLHRLTAVKTRSLLQFHSKIRPAYRGLLEYCSDSQENPRNSLQTNIRFRKQLKSRTSIYRTSLWRQTHGISSFRRSPTCLDTTSGWPLMCWYGTLWKVWRRLSSSQYVCNLTVLIGKFF